MRRGIDIVVGIVGCVIALPVMAMLAVIGILVFRGNPFFVQQRIGRHGRPFTFLKLRTLPKDAPAYADKYALNTVAVPRFGRVLRGTHLDELPQVLHVLLGQMSLVGPRPEMPFLHRQMDPVFAQARVAVRPGWTGLWQIGADAHRLIREAPDYDLFYLQHRTMRMDAWIIWRTAVSVVLSGRGVRVEDAPRWVRRRTSTPEGIGQDHATAAAVANLDRGRSGAASESVSTVRSA